MNKALSFAVAAVASLLFASPALAFTINASADAGSTISPAGAVTVAPGADQGFAIGAGNGFHITSVTVDGSGLGPVSSVTFLNVQGDHSIGVASANNGGGGLIFCSGPMAPGYNVSLPGGGCGGPTWVPFGIAVTFGGITTSCPFQQGCTLPKR